MKKPITKDDVKFAKDYLDYCIHEGCQGIEDSYEGLTDEEIVEYATDLMDRSDQAYDAWKESGGI